MTTEIGDSNLIDTWAATGTIIEPDISKKNEGWTIGERPLHEYMNWIQNTFGQKINHILSRGIADWNIATPYLIGAVVSYNGSPWLAKDANTGSVPTGSNANWFRLDNQETTLAELGITATAAELNVLDGINASTAELNRLNGITSTTTELNKLDGFTGTVTSLNYAESLRATGVTVAEFERLDGIIASTTELNYVDGVTSDIQPQLDLLRNLSSGPNSPTSPVAGMLWYHTVSKWLFRRNDENSSWVRFVYFDQASGRTAIDYGTSIVNYAGEEQAKLSNQLNIDWTTGTSTLNSLVSPDMVKRAIQALSPDPTTGQVRAAMAGAAYGSVGTYVMAGAYFSSSPYQFIQNTLHSGSLLQPAGVAVNSNTTNDGADSDGYPTAGGQTLSGTWRCMGRAVRTSSGTLITSFLRIS